MAERRERIPAEEVPDPERWKLPFWTEPNHLVQQEKEQLDEQDDDVLVEEEEIEVEPLTAEQLEAIRQEAYNEGLEQGLIEGRQKGEKQGHEEGYQEGLKSGHDEGHKLGYETGLTQGEEKAKTTSEITTQNAIEDAQKIFSALADTLTQQQQDLQNEMPSLVLALAKAVVMEELQQGSEHIQNLVQLALSSLPLDSQGIEIRVNAKDLPFVEAAQEQTGFKAKILSVDHIEAGGCEIQSQYSAIDFTLNERWKTISKQFQSQLQLGINTLTSTEISDIGEKESDFGAEDQNSVSADSNHSDIELDEQDSSPGSEPSVSTDEQQVSNNDLSRQDESDHES
jgi:flagellar assembly protein FliH